MSSFLTSITKRRKTPEQLANSAFNNLCTLLSKFKIYLNSLKIIIIIITIIIIIIN